jgi:hypothetical protein
MMPLPPSALPAVRAAVILEMCSEELARLAVRRADNGRLLRRSPETWLEIIRGQLVVLSPLRMIKGGAAAAFVQSMPILLGEPGMRMKAENDGVRQGSEGDG